LAGFQVTINGRFWVTAEVEERVFQDAPCHQSNQKTGDLVQQGWQIAGIKLVEEQDEQRRVYFQLVVPVEKRKCGAQNPVKKLSRRTRLAEI